MSSPGPVDAQPRSAAAPRQLVVLSGKGGTGKTSVVAALATLTDRKVLADCDVDAADLHLILAPRTRERREFRSGNEAVIRKADCTACGTCLSLCRFDAVRKREAPNGKTVFSIDPVSCEGCGVCVRFCPAQAIDFPERVCGQWMVSDTRAGPMVHARLDVAAENSGKLVSAVRREARRIAGEAGLPLILVDGPPGIGCPVIASVTGASQALIVTEPTVSGEHDLQRALSLTRHFKIPTAMCVNKWDINPAQTERMEHAAEQAGVRRTGRIRYDPSVTAAQMQSQAVVEIRAPSADDIRRVWEELALAE